MLEVYATPSSIRSPKDPVFWLGEFRDFAEHLTGKRDMRSLYAACAARGVGMERVTLRDAGRAVYHVILDGLRREGIFVACVDGKVAARMRDGVITAADPTLVPVLTALLKKLPPSKALEWNGGARRPAPPRDEAPAKKPEATSKKTLLTASARHELASAADAGVLTAIELAQLKAAVPELSGKKTLAGLWAWLEATDQSVVLLRFSEGKKPRYDGWLLGALEDGVFFEHGARKPSGLTISQGEVSDGNRARRVTAVAALQAAMKKVRLPRRRR
jgi:hypothetical protein